MERAGAERDFTRAGGNYKACKKVGALISQQLADRLLEIDLNEFRRQRRRMFGETGNAVIDAVLVNLLYQRGYGTMSQYPGFIRQVKAKDRFGMVENMKMWNWYQTFTD